MFNPIGDVIKSRGLELNRANYLAANGQTEGGLDCEQESELPEYVKSQGYKENTSMSEIKPLYKGAQVTIVENSNDPRPDALLKINDGGSEFWIRRSRLTFPAAIIFPVYVAQPVPESLSDFVEYLKSSGYTLHVVCRTPEQVEAASSEYRDWSGGIELPSEAIRMSFDGTEWDREWFLIFKYSPSIEYPFAVLERGTGGRKRQKNPVAWHRKGKIESCYTAVAEQMVRAGLSARY